MLGLLRKELSAVLACHRDSATSHFPPREPGPPGTLRVFDLHGACIGAGQSQVWEGPFGKNTRKGQAQLCRKDIGPLDLEGWGGREVETTPSCPLGWLREEQLRVGKAMGWGKGMNLVCSFKFQMKDSSPFSHSEGLRRRRLCASGFFFPFCIISFG